MPVHSVTRQSEQSTQNWVPESLLSQFCFGVGLPEGARLRGRTATQRSKKGSEKVLGRVLGKGSQKGSQKAFCYGFYSKRGF